MKFTTAILAVIPAILAQPVQRRSANLTVTVEFLGDGGSSKSDIPADGKTYKIKDKFDPQSFRKALTMTSEAPGHVPYTCYLDSSDNDNLATFWKTHEVAYLSKSPEDDDTIHCKAPTK